MRIVLGILIALIAIAVTVLLLIRRLALALYPITHRKIYGPLPGEELEFKEPTPQVASGLDANAAPSLFETIVEESREKS